MTENPYLPSTVLDPSPEVTPQLSDRVHHAAYAVSICAFVVYCLALAAPAIYEGGYKDGTLVVVPDSRQSGLACLVFSCIFFPRFLLFAFANVYFIGATLLHLYSRSRVAVSSLRRWLAAVGPLAAIWYGIGRSDKLLVGYYLWVAALVLFYVGNHLRSSRSTPGRSTRFPD